MEQDDFLQLEMEAPAGQQCLKLSRSSSLMVEDLEVCLDLINSIVQPFTFIVEEIYSLWLPLNPQFFQVQAKGCEAN